MNYFSLSYESPQSLLYGMSREARVYNAYKNRKPDWIRICDWDTGRSRSKCRLFRYRFVNGELREIEVDEDDDGDVDRRMKRKTVYEENGRKVYTEIEEDTNADGVPDAKKKLYYDANGDVKRIEFDDNADGTPDRFWPESEPV